MRYALITLLLAGCASGPAPVTDSAYSKAYAEGWEDGRAETWPEAYAAGQAEAPTRVIRIMPDDCPPPGNGLVRDRPPTNEELAREIDRLLRLYRICSMSPDE